MKNSLEAGLTRVETISVDKDRTISFLGEDMRVYSTPAMVTDMEYACFRLLQDYLDDPESSVGIRVAIDHVAATPLGEDVRISVEIESVDGRKVHFRSEIRDAVETVGRGKHVRFIIDRDQHAERLAEKRARF